MEPISSTDQQKAAAKARYLQAGGTESDFEKDWPQIRRQIAADAAARTTEREAEEARAFLRRNS